MWGFRPRGITAKVIKKMDKEELDKLTKQMGEPGPAEELFFARRRALGLGVGLDENGQIVSMGGPVFIDFEASSLSSDSWPIEVGLAWCEGKRVAVESKLIRPRPDWPESDWNAESQAVHGIPRSDLDDASTADDVTIWLLDTVEGRPLFSDAPEFDQRWMNRLLGHPGPEIADFDGAVCAAFSSEGCLAPGRLHKVYRNMQNRPTLHRAGADAANLAYAWRAGIGK